jgi:undecaprenyl diphosphate synthase
METTESGGPAVFKEMRIRRDVRGKGNPRDLQRDEGKGPLPSHIAIIMDGNGRWARQRGLPRIAGHRTGVDTAREIVRACHEWGVRVLTLYTFSVENWKRPKTETTALMRLLEEFIQREIHELMEKDIQLRVIGRMEGLPCSTQRQLRQAVEETRTSRGLILNLALNYGGRSEIVDAVKAILAEIQSGKMTGEDLNEQTFSHFLYTADLPDPDLLVRTGGEMRVSNFLLYQLAYAEFWTTSTFWPDFKPGDLWEAITSYQQRERRFGMISEQPREAGAGRHLRRTPNPLGPDSRKGGDDAC